MHSLTPSVKLQAVVLSSQSKVETISQFEDTSLSLLERARREDPEAWRRIVCLYGPLVLHWCRRAGLPEHDAQDVCQETFSAVARALPAFRRDRQSDSFRGWLRVITRNKLTDYQRRRPKVPDAVGGSEHLRRVEDWTGPVRTKCDYHLATD